MTDVERSESEQPAPSEPGSAEAAVTSPLAEPVEAEPVEGLLAELVEAPLAELVEAPLAELVEAPLAELVEAPLAAREALRQAQRTDAEPTEDPAATALALAAQPPAEAAAALSALVMERAGDAAPVLAALAQQAPFDLAIKAMEALTGLRSQAAADALGSVGASRADAKRAKEARRFLHKLSLVGLKPSPVAPAPRPEPAPDKVFACMASPADGMGFRTVAIVRQNRFGTLRMGVFVLNEEDGVVEAYGSDPCSMSTWKRFLEGANAGDAKMATVDLAFCQEQLDVATSRNERSRSPLPERYYYYAGLAIGKSEPRARPPELAVEAIRNAPELLGKSSDLAQSPECETWLFDEDKMQPYAVRMIAEWRRLNQVEQERRSQVHVLDFNTLQREGTIVSLAMNEMLDGAQRARLQARLEYTADLFWRSERLEEARWAMAAALALAPESTLPVDQHPFLRQLMIASLDAAVKEEMASQRTPEQSGPVALPDKRAKTEEKEEYVDEQGYIRRKSGLIIPR